MGIKIFKVIFFFVGVLILIDALLPTVEADREISELQRKSRKLSGNYIIIFKDDFKCSVDLADEDTVNFRPNERVTVKSTRFTRECVHIEKSGVELYRDSYWRILFVLGALLCIGYGVSKINFENWWRR
ncbi:MAG TPA: hypothetical protein VIZ65_05315 [Cellvibrionaceae bacterium]